MLELAPIPQRRPKCMPIASRKTLEWYRAFYERTGLSYKQTQRLKMLSYGIHITPGELSLTGRAAKDHVCRLRKRLPWLVIQNDRLRGYIVPQPCLDELKRFLEDE